jgi:hypothetical protein
VSDKFMMTEQTSDNLLIARSVQLVDSSPLRGAMHSFAPITFMKGTVLTVAKIARLKKLSWKQVVLAEGAKGPIIVDVACLRVYPILDNLPMESPVWLFLRRMEDGQIKYAFSNAPETMLLAELCEAATMRWPIEQCFQDGKSEVGMDQYEHRSWPAWHRHMLYVFLALQLLLRLRLRLIKAPALTLHQARILIMVVLPCQTLTHARALELVRYYKTRNYIAYRSHRKMSMGARAK